MDTSHMLFSGVIHVTGEHDTGKTTFAFEAAQDPSRICFFDADVKGRSTVDGLVQAGIQLGAHHDLVGIEKKCKGNEAAFHDEVVKILDDIQPGQFDVLIWDTFRRFEKTLYSVVKRNPQNFRKEWAYLGSIKGAEQRAEADEYGARLLNDLVSKIPLVIVVTHLKDHYIGEVNTGKKVPEHGRALNRICRMRIWLRRNPASPVPIGLILKRMDTKVLVPGVGLRTTAIFPPKLTPGVNDAGQSLWDTIAYYMKNPVGNRPLESYEKPNAFELSIIEDTLTSDQMIVLRAATMAQDNQAEVSNQLADLAAERARQLAKEGLSAPAIVARMIQEVENGGLVVDIDRLTVPIVAGWIS